MTAGPGLYQWNLQLDLQTVTFCCKCSDHRHGTGSSGLGSKSDSESDSESSDLAGPRAEFTGTGMSDSTVGSESEPVQA
jgi:hypothetical protein